MCAESDGWSIGKARSLSSGKVKQRVDRRVTLLVGSSLVSWMVWRVVQLAPLSHLLFSHLIFFIIFIWVQCIASRIFLFFSSFPLFLLCASSTSPSSSVCCPSRGEERRFSFKFSVKCRFLVSCIRTFAVRTSKKRSEEKWKLSEFYIAGLRTFGGC